MDNHRIDQILGMKNESSSAVEALTLELLERIGDNTNQILQLLIRGQGDVANPIVAEPTKAQIEAEKEKAVGTAPVEVKKPVAKKKAAPKKVEKVAPDGIKEEPMPIAEKMLPTKDGVMKELVNFIGENDEAALAEILEGLGGYKNFPSVPQDKYPALLNAIK